VTTAAITIGLLAAGCSSASKPATALSSTASSTGSSTGSSTAGTTTSATTTAATTTAATTSSASACSLATLSDVSGVYGEQFGAGKASNPGGYSNCLFPPSSGAIDSVSFTVAHGSQAELFYAGNKTAYQSSDVSGVGDKAFVSDDGGAFGVERGSVAILVHVVGFEHTDVATLKAKQEMMAKLLLSHLP
jgi:hypothetical protein